MRLGVLGRAVIVASCFSMAGGTLFFAIDADDEGRAAAAAAYKACMGLAYSENADGTLDLSDCQKSRDVIHRSHTSELAGGLWGYAAIRAAVILALGLLAFAILYGSARWIAAGRLRHPNIGHSGDEHG